jgi:hypothetical protein
MLEATKFEVSHRSLLQWHDLPTELNKNLLIDSKVIRGTHREKDRKEVYLTSLTFIFKEIRLKFPEQ